MEKNKKYTVYYGSEENGYECEELGTFDTIEEARECIRESVKDIIESEGYEGEDAEEILEEIMENEENRKEFRAWGTLDYNRVWTINDEETIDGLREEMIKECEGCEDEDEYLEDED